MPHAPHDSDDEPDCRVGQPPTQERGSEVAAPSALLRDVLEHGPRHVCGHRAPEGPQSGGAKHPRRPADGDGDDEGQREDADRHAIGPQPAWKPRDGVGTAQRRIAQSQDGAGQDRCHDPYERPLSPQGVGVAQGVVDEEPDPAGAEDDDTENDETGQGARGGCAAGWRCITHTHMVQYEYWTTQPYGVDRLLSDRPHQRSRFPQRLSTVSWRCRWQQLAGSGGPTPAGSLCRRSRNEGLRPS